jgi:hypothetical protein
MYYKVVAGPAIRFPHGRFIPYAHALAGGAKVNGSALQKLTWGEGTTLGGGADYVLPHFKDHLAVRGQADSAQAAWSTSARSSQEVEAEADTSVAAFGPPSARGLRLTG